MTARLAPGAQRAALRRQVGPSAWCALECLVERSADGVTSAASVRAIADDLGVAKNTAHRAIAALLRAGLVEIEQGRDDDGRFLPGRYRLLLGGLLETAPTRRPRATPAATTATTQLSLLG